MKALYALVGMQHRNALEFVAQLQHGDPMTLVREPENPYDPFAVQVWARGVHVGFIKAGQAKALALRMDSSGNAVVGKLVKREHWPLIEVEE